MLRFIRQFCAQQSIQYTQISCLFHFLCLRSGFMAVRFTQVILLSNFIIKNNNFVFYFLLNINKIPMTSFLCDLNTTSRDHFWNNLRNRSLSICHMIESHIICHYMLIKMNTLASGKRTHTFDTSLSQISLLLKLTDKKPRDDSRVGSHARRDPRPVVRRNIYPLLAGGAAPKHTLWLPCMRATDPRGNKEYKSLSQDQVSPRSASA